MRYFLLMMLLSCSRLAAQNKTEELQERLYQEIEAHKMIEFRFVGCIGSLSSFYPKVDSFLHILQPEDVDRYFERPGRATRYYLFMATLYRLKDESKALEQLRSSIYDSSELYFDYSYGKNYFNELLIREYRRYLRSRYYYGGSGANIMFTFHFPPANRKIYRKKTKELQQVLAAAGLSPDIIHDKKRY